MLLALSTDRAGEPMVCKLLNSLHAYGSPNFHVSLTRCDHTCLGIVEHQSQPHLYLRFPWPGAEQRFGR